MRKKLLTLLLGVCLTVSTAGLASASTFKNSQAAKAAKKDLTIWAWGADAEAKAREVAIKVFIKEHPELNVKYSIIPTANNAWDQKASAALAAGNGPDVMQMSPDYYGMRTKYFEDLNPYVKKDNLDLSKLLVPGFINGYYDTDGKLEGFPLLANCFVVAYNKDMFDKYKVPYPKDGWTIADLLKWGKPFVGGSGAKQTYAMAKHWCMDLLMLYAGGGTPYTSNLATSNMGSKQILDALTLYGKLIKGGYVPTSAAQKSTSAETLFISGLTAMYTLGGMESESVINDAEKNGIHLGYCMMPSGLDGKEINLQFATGWAITKTSKNKEAAWEFLKESAYANKDMCKATCACGMTSSKEVANNYFAKLVIGKSKFSNSLYVNHMGKTHLNPWGGTLSSSGDLWGKMIDAVTINGKDPASIQATYAPQIESLFSNYKFSSKKGGN